ncbi:MAG: mevalonate kinase [Thaumarchaeota archaeon]|nr:mevalonate kinase [Nitrososphaerota archaeon]
MAEAPGKVIISGEHFVVHGATAVASAIERKVRVEATRSNEVQISSQLRGARVLLPSRKLVDSLYKLHGHLPRVKISITSALADGAGLGSSAATMLAITGAVSALEGWDRDVPSLIERASAGERVIHGRPSGVDATVSAMGGVILYRMGEPPRRVDVNGPVRLLVAYSGRRRSTGKLIKKVAGMKKSYPAMFAHLCESATMISKLCSERLLEGDSLGLARLMTYNHAVLGSAGASNRRLDALVDLCLASGCLGAKLTGAGGGGSVLAVPPVDEVEAQAAIGKLARKGYSSFFTVIPTEGLRIWTEE